MKTTALSSAILLALGASSSALADDLEFQCGEERCDEVLVISAEPMQSPLTTVTDPKQPRQPLPAFDGSGFLKTLPGFTVTRKGGSGGDISLRGLGGSRVNIVNDGKQMGGTCGGRMDPPTNYISPETFEKVTIIKGPQTVKYGPVGSAGTVLFERDHYGVTEKGAEGRASLTAGNFGRQDYLFELTTGDTEYYWSLDVNGSESDDFEDGDGRSMQSEYDRENLHTAIGWTPDEHSVIELSYGNSSGNAEYADRANKARTIDNENLTLFAKTALNYGPLTGIEFQAYGNENDHIMDQFDRPVEDPDNLPVGMNPRRTNYGGHLYLDLSFDNISATVGLDHLDSTQDMRSGTSLDQLESAPYKDVFSKTQWGLFIESDIDLGQGTLFTGLRWDNWQTKLLGMWAGANKDNSRSDDLFSGFGRYELAQGNHSWILGFGHAQRPADYWEVMKASKKLTLEAETTNQLDIGWHYDGDVVLSASLFYADIQDYILIDTQSMPNARNIDASLYGGELSLSYDFADAWQWVTTVAYTHGDNDTDKNPLGQVSPLEAKFALNYDGNDWGMGVLWRVVAEQDRVAVGQGNIVGQDLGETAGFGVLSINVAYKHWDDLTLSLGIDNLLDKTYAEHVSKSGAGNDLLLPEERTVQVNEPGRTLWAKLDYKF
ncbi:TonB-dependent copper receptor [Ferrimonas aestuarii]|nr:TonB-dependent copper receptor [Ferrimonas aestuarii]